MAERRASEAKRFDVAGFYGDDAVLILQNAFDEEERVAHHSGVVFFEELRLDDDVGDTVSSSRLRKTKPLAVPGRWRAITAPATNEHASRSTASRAAGETPL